MASKTVDSANGEISTGPVTLTASTADTVTFTNDVDLIEVQSDGTADLFVRTDGSAATTAGKNARRLPAGAISSLQIPLKGLSVSLISTGATKYSVTKVS